MLLFLIHFAKGFAKPGRHKNRIVTKTFVTPGRPDQITFDPAFKIDHLTIGPAKRQGTNEGGVAILNPGLIQFGFDLFHGKRKIFVRTRPAGGMDTGIAIERYNSKPGIVRQCGKT